MRSASLPVRSAHLADPLPAFPVLVLALLVLTGMGGFALAVAQARWEESLFVAAAVGLPFIVISVANPRWLLATLFIGSGTALFTTFLGRETLVASLGGLNASSLSLLGTTVAMSLIVLVRIEQVSLVLKRVRWHLLFLGFAGLSIFWSPDTLLGIRSWVLWFFPLLSVLVAFTVWRARPMLGTLKVMLWVYAGIAITGPLVYFVGNPGSVYWQGRALYTGSWGVAANEFGALVGLLSVFALVEYHFNRRGLFAVLAVIFGLSALATQVLSAIFPLFIVVGVFFLLTSRSTLRWIYPLLGLVALLIASTSFGPIKDRTFGVGNESISVSTIWSEPEQLITPGNIRFTRVVLWTDIRDNLFAPQPLTGGGLGSFDHLFGDDRSTVVTPSNAQAGTYIGLLGELGLLGLGMYLFALGYYLFSLWKLYLTGSLAVRKYSLLGILWLLYFVGYSFAYNPTGTWTLTFLVFSVIGIALASDSLTNSSKGAETGSHTDNLESGQNLKKDNASENS